MKHLKSSLLACLGTVALPLMIVGCGKTEPAPEKTKTPAKAEAKDVKANADKPKPAEKRSEHPEHPE